MTRTQLKRSLYWPVTCQVSLVNLVQHQYQVSLALEHCDNEPVSRVKNIRSVNILSRWLLRIYNQYAYRASVPYDVLGKRIGRRQKNVNLKELDEAEDDAETPPEILISKYQASDLANEAAKLKSMEAMDSVPTDRLVKLLTQINTR